MLSNITRLEASNVSKMKDVYISSKHVGPTTAQRIVCRACWVKSVETTVHNNIGLLIKTMLSQRLLSTLAKQHAQQKKCQS